MGTSGRRRTDPHPSLRASAPTENGDAALAAERAARARAMEAAERLQRENRAKDEFLSELAHELRTPLTAILGWASLLRSRQFDAAVVAKGLETIELSARAQAQLIDDLSDLSRVVSGKLRLELRPLDLRLPAQTAIEAARPSAEAKGLHLMASIPDTPCLVRGDRTRLQQVIGNLLTNAVKFTAEGGTVEVAIQRDGGRVRLVVRDSGIGISPDLLPYVFDRFRQADDATTRAHGGLGLGLSIVRHLAQLHGGDVMAASDGEGHGATFTVDLPEAGSVARRADDSPTAGDGAHPSGPMLRGVTVLLVEDDAPSRQTIAALLEQEGADVVAAPSAAEALETLRHRPPDVLVSDIAMPGMDGYALIRTLRGATPSLRSIPAIALTGFGRGSDRERALREGFQLHVPKPVDSRALATAVVSVVRPAVPVDTGSVDDQLAELDALRADGGSAAVVHAEVDHLERIRARHGAAGVDAVARYFVETARRSVRASDRLVVTSPGSIAVFCYDADADTARTVAERLRDAAAAGETVMDDGRAVRVTASVGVASGAVDRPDGTI
ncbi:MAG: ATP-binding protein, partial [Chloroflexota bacterium]|nr:ATP-binding protein [Chloroflexota bacterium]